MKLTRDTRHTSGDAGDVRGKVLGPSGRRKGDGPGSLAPSTITWPRTTLPGTVQLRHTFGETSGPEVEYTP